MVEDKLNQLRLTRANSNLKSSYHINIYFVRFSDSLLILYSPPHMYGTIKSTPYPLFTPSHVRHQQVHSLFTIHPLTRTALSSPLLILYSPPHTYGTTKSTPYLLFTPSHVRHYQVHSLSSIHPLKRTALPSPLLIFYSPPQTYSTTKSQSPIEKLISLQKNMLILLPKIWQTHFFIDTNNF